MIAAHARGGGFQCLTGIGRQVFERGLELRGVQFQTRQRSGSKMVEALGVFEHCRIPAGLDVLQDRGNGMLDGRISGIIKLQQARQARLKVWLRTIESGERNHGIPASKNPIKNLAPIVPFFGVLPSPASLFQMVFIPIPEIRQSPDC